MPLDRRFIIMLRSMKQLVHLQAGSHTNAPLDGMVHQALMS